MANDKFGDMIEDRLDLAMRVGEIAEASVIARRIGIAARVVVAAPSYIQRHGIPSEPRDLAQHICIVHHIEPDSDVWTFGGQDGTRNIKVSGGILANDGSTVHLAACAGYHRLSSAGPGRR